MGDLLAASITEAEFKQICWSLGLDQQVLPNFMSPRTNNWHGTVTRRGSRQRLGRISTGWKHQARAGIPSTVRGGGTNGSA
jgi:hypothetical protein